MFLTFSKSDLEAINVFKKHKLVMSRNVFVDIVGGEIVFHGEKKCQISNIRIGRQNKTFPIN